MKIKTKLLIVLSILLLLFLTASALSLWVMFDLRVAKGIMKTSSVVSNSILKAKTNDKDFLLKKDTEYIKMNKTNIDTALANIDELIKGETNPEKKKELESFKETVKKYHQQFIEVTQLSIKRGLDSESGLYGAFRNAIHKLEDEVKESNLDSNLKIMVSMLLCRRHEKDYMLRGSKKYLDRFNNEIIKLRQLVKNSLQNSDKFMVYIDDYYEGFHALFKIDRDIEAKTEEFNKTIGKLDAFVEGILDRVSDIESRALIVLIFTYASILLSILIFIFTIITANRLFRKLYSAITVLNKISEGNLDVSTTKEKSKNEIGMLINAIHSLNDRLVKIIHSVKTSINRFTQTTTDISNGNIDLAERTNKEAANLEEITASIEEMSASIDLNLNQSIKAEKLSEKIKTSMESLDESSRKMREIIQVIESISFETNLLALNASIEAARAGQAGKGFEVVASEVKELSQKSATQAKEIINIIEQNVANVDENVNLIDNINDIINELRISNQNQNDTSKQITEAISQLNELSQKNAQLVNEYASSSEMIADQARNLEKEVAFFKLKKTRKQIPSPKKEK